MASHLNSLLPEILPNIFKFLPADDRKSVRLTCRSFKDACNRIEIIKQEKFVFHLGHYGNHMDATCLAKSIVHFEKFRSAVEFCNVDLRELPTSVWRKLGDRITSLRIYDCHVNAQIIARIFRYCSELVDFRLDVPTKVDFNTLLALGIKRPKLRSFEFFNRNEMCDVTFQEILKIFPNINTLGREHFDRSLDDFRPRDAIPLVCSKVISLPPSVENFVYNKNSDGAWLLPFIRNPTLKLKELECTFTISDFEEMITIIDFFSSQTELKRVDLRILCKDRTYSRGVKNIMLYICENSPKLKALKFHSNCGIGFSQSEFTYFMAIIHNLESLDLSFATCVFHPQFLGTQSSPTDFCNLRRLRLNFDFGHTKLFQLEILSHCRSLQCLWLRAVCRETLRYILENQTELKQLTIYFDALRFIDSFIGEYSFDRLRNLEHLEVRRSDYSSHDPTELERVIELVSGLNCRALKVFVLAGWRASAENTIALLCTLSSRTPLLETLILGSELRISEYPLYGMNFKKLRYLILPQHASETKLIAYVSLFEACPSLKYIIVSSGYKAWAHFYHRETRYLSTQNGESIDRLCKMLNIITDEHMKLKFCTTFPRYFPRCLSD